MRHFKALRCRVLLPLSSSPVPLAIKFGETCHTCLIAANSGLLKAGPAESISVPPPMPDVINVVANRVFLFDQ